MEDARPGHVVTVAVLVSLPFFVAGVAADAGVAGTLTTTEPVQVDGSLNATAASGVAHAWAPGAEADLEADRLEAEIQWERGATFGTEDWARLYRHVDQRGVDWYNFTSATVEFSVFDRRPQILSLPGNAAVSVTAQAPGAAEAGTVENESLARHGENQTEGTFEVAGFFYTVGDPHVALTGADTARVSGNFTLFVNNVTIQVTDSDQGDWSNWTGYKESNPDSPAGPLENPGAKEYEIRSTTIRVTNGTLWVNATDAVDLYAEDVNASVNGSVTAPSVSGELLSEPRLYEYDDDPLRMFGSGRLDTGLAADDSSGEPMQSQGTTTTTPPLELGPSGSFDVQRTQGVEVREAGTASAWSPVSWLDGTTWIALAVLGATVVGAGVGATVPERVHRVIGAAYSGWREDRYERWIREGNMATDAHEFERAKEVFAKARSLNPSAPDAYLGLMTAHAGTNEVSTALRIAREARDEIGATRLPSTLSQLWIAYADKEGEAEHVVQAWLAIAQAEPQKALMVYVEEDYEALEGDPRVEGRIEQIKDELFEANPKLAQLFGDQRPLPNRDTDGDRDGGAEPGPEIA